MYEATIPRMSCKGCARAITGAIVAYDPDAQVKISLADKHIAVQTTLPAEALEACLRDAGYPPA